MKVDNCVGSVVTSARVASKRPTHFLALRLQSPPLWEHVFSKIIFYE